jgi:hypothetical protein
MDHAGREPLRGTRKVPRLSPAGGQGCAMREPGEARAPFSRSIRAFGSAPDQCSAAEVYFLFMRHRHHDVTLSGEPERDEQQCRKKRTPLNVGSLWVWSLRRLSCLSSSDTKSTRGFTRCRRPPGVTFRSPSPERRIWRTSRLSPPSAMQDPPWPGFASPSMRTTSNITARIGGDRRPLFRDPGRCAILPM